MNPSRSSSPNQSRFEEEGVVEELREVFQSVASSDNYSHVPHEMVELACEVLRRQGPEAESSKLYTSLEAQLARTLEWIQTDDLQTVIDTMIKRNRLNVLEKIVARDDVTPAMLLSILSRGPNFSSVIAAIGKNMVCKQSPECRRAVLDTRNPDAIGEIYEYLSLGEFEIFTARMREQWANKKLRKILIEKGVPSSVLGEKDVLRELFHNSEREVRLVALSALGEEGIVGI